MDSRKNKPNHSEASPVQKPQPSSAKKSYAAPSLVEYGSIAKLTQGSATNGADGGAGKKNPCL